MGTVVGNVNEEGFVFRDWSSELFLSIGMFFKVAVLRMI